MTKAQKEIHDQLNQHSLGMMLENISKRSEKLQFEMMGFRELLRTLSTMPADDIHMRWPNIQKLIKERLDTEIN